MKFDTRDKKPKLYNILIPTAIAAAIIAGLLLWETKESEALISLTLDLYWTGVLILLVDALFKQMQYNPYSYNTIYYIGFSLFVFSILITEIVWTVRLFRSPGQYPRLNHLYWMAGSAKSYMLLSFPFTLIFSALLFLSNVSLIRHEGKRLVNVLGIILSLLMTGGALLLYRLDYYVSGSAQEILIHALFTNLYSAVYLYFECMLIGAIAASVIAARYEPEMDKDFLIILGCGLRKDGTPTPLLRGRIDRAIAFARRQKEETGKDLIFVASGGQGPREAVSESASIKQYLISQGVPEDRIVMEDRSTDTLENMKFSKEKIAQIDPTGKVAFSTTKYHVFRSGLCARRVKMRAVGMGARTRWYFWPNAWVREFVGLLTEHRGKQALILGALIVIYTVLTLLVYP